MKGLRACVTIAIAGWMACQSLSAQAKPALGGEWKLNVGKSDFGPLQTPRSRVDKIRHEEPSVHINTSVSNANGDFTYDVRYSTDGSETKNDIFGNPSTCVAKWDGAVLVVDTKGAFQGNDYTAADRYSLSSDGKTLTVERNISSAAGAAHQKMVFEKQ